MQRRLALLKEKLHQVDRLAGLGELPNAEITGELLKVSPLKKSVPEEAEQLEDEAFALMPHLKITELLLEVDQWTDFTRHLSIVGIGDRATQLVIAFPTVYGPQHVLERPFRSSSVLILQTSEESRSDSRRKMSIPEYFPFAIAR